MNCITFISIIQQQQFIQIMVLPYDQDDKIYQLNSLLIQKMSLLLSIKCLFAQPQPKQYTIKIHNQQLNISMLIQNIFIHNYQYYYQLWPSSPGKQYQLHIELQEKVAGEFICRGQVSAKIKCTLEGDLYKMHGSKQKDQLILMKFKIEDQREVQIQKQSTELKKINKQMQQNLQKYRKQIQGYRQFLFFTNNVIKELKKDPVQTDLKPYKPLLQDVHNSKSKQQINPNPSLHNSSQLSQQPQHPQSIHSNQQGQPQTQLLIQNQQREIVTPDSQKSRFTKFPSEVKQDSNEYRSSQASSKTYAKSQLTKYMYLEQYKYNKESIQESQNYQTSIVRSNTPINTLQQQVNNSQSIKQSQQSNLISNQIKKRRQLYLIPKQVRPISRKSYAQKNNQVCSSTPFSKKSNFSLINKNTNKQVSVASSNNQQPQSKVNQSKNSLKQIRQSKPILKDVSQCNDSRLNSSEHPDLKQSFHSNKSQIIKTTRNKPNLISNIMMKQSIKQSLKQQQIPSIRRRKLTMKNETKMSARDNIQQMNHSNMMNNSKVHQFGANKLTIFNIHTLFYTNYKSSVKKCIVEHNNKIYQTSQQQNNLKETSWNNDKITINSLSPFEQIIFQIYSLTNHQLLLQGSAIVSINSILTNKHYHLKYYLYYDQIAVGFINFDVQKQPIQQKRLSISLPQVKSKNNKEIDSNASRTSRNQQKRNEFEDEISPKKSISNQSIQSSNEQNSHITINYEELNSKIRNLKLQRKNRLK